MLNSNGTDVHQHLWPPGFVAALRGRAEPPYLRDWTLQLNGEPPYEARAADHDTDQRRANEVCAQAIVALSSPLGIEDLPPAQAQPLLDAWHDDVRKLGEPFRAWAALNRTDPDLAGLADLLAAGLVGLQVPATWLTTPAGLEACAPMLRTCEQLDRPVFVHPGPTAVRVEGPPWWPAVADYPAQLQAAWWSWRTVGRALLPDLRICFAAGAGLAPVHHERFVARGGPSVPLDRDLFVETSSYGRQGVDALVRALGIDVVVFGSDRPYADPADPHLGAAALQALRVANPLRLLEGDVE